MKIAGVKFERKFLITVKMVKGKWILFWNSTVITKVQVCYFFKYKIQLFRITANMYIPCEGIYKYTSQTVLFSGLKKIKLDED